MSDGIIKLASTGTPAQDFAGDLAAKVKAMIYGECQARAVSLALVIGVLEIVKLEIVDDQKN